MALESKRVRLHCAFTRAIEPIGIKLVAWITGAGKGYIGGVLSTALFTTQTDGVTLI